MKRRSVTMYGGTIPVLFLKEGDAFIWHSPVLDLSSCGATFKEAERNFREALAIFFAECIKHHTLDAALESYGWQKSKTGHAQWQPPHLVGLDSLPVNIPIAA